MPRKTSILLETKAKTVLGRAKHRFLSYLVLFVVPDRVADGKTKPCRFVKHLNAIKSNVLGIERQTRGLCARDILAIHHTCIGQHVQAVTVRGIFDRHVQILNGQSKAFACKRASTALSKNAKRSISSAIGPYMVSEPK